ncbi:MAG: type I restriction endonuclease subunit R, partial [Flavobacteriales bacterium]|nr:type I restriction endonuclease subunit R [Flavobacteriales bacterium]
MNNSPEYQLSELPAIELFQKMGYQYYNGGQVEERNDITEVVLIDRLLKSIRHLNPLLSDINIQKAFDIVTSVTGSSLMEINQKIWEIINGDSISMKQVIDGEEQFIPVKFIDYLVPDNNDYLVVNQMRFHGLSHNSVPDLVLFINGLPIAVIEAKSPTAQNAWDKAYTDLDYYQKNSEKLFHFNQICVGIWKDGARYGAISSPQQFYSVYKTS